MKIAVKNATLAVGFLCLLMFGHSVFAVSVDSVRLWRAPDNTRIVFDLSGPVQHNMFMLSNPRRLVIDIENARFKADLKELGIANTPVSKIRTGKRGANDLRVVLDLKEKVDPKIFTLVKHGDKNDRLVLDLFDAERIAEPVIVIPSPTTQSRRDIVIAVDAGHGGEDPGAIGSKRVYEKNVVLDISKRLVNIINKQPGYKAQLTRTGDYYIELKKRPALARAMRADLFVSVHADAFRNSGARGASVYALNRRGAKATSDTARYLAQKENKADLIGGVGNVNLKDKDETLAGVLVDLSMTHTLSSSLEVGQNVLSSMGSLAKLHKSHVEQANFAVLRSADMPSILVETGFISNPGEAKRLSTPAYRQQMAEKIFKGVRHYFNKTPPVGSYIAWMKNNGNQKPSEHVITRGDTLSEIAKRYNVSVNEILRFNGLSNTVIRIGQRIKIPTS
ncbi:MAG: N-acetylmuramoyl-L-alanine amidase [Cellvibrionaceae bacterium]